MLSRHRCHRTRGLRTGPRTSEPRFGVVDRESAPQYKAAKAAGTLGGKSWNDFRKTECGTTAAPAAAPAGKADKPSPIATGKAVFPSKIDAEYSTLSAGKARQKTCLEQIPCQQGVRRQWRPEKADTEGRRLLQSVYKRLKG